MRDIRTLKIFNRWFLGLLILGVPLLVTAKSLAPLSPSVATDVHHLWVSKKGDWAGAVGGHKFRKIQPALEAANALTGPVVIHIAAGDWEEKLYITRDNLALVGAGPAKTKIHYAELRENWLARRQVKKTAQPDWGAAVINLAASDIALLDLTVINDYGQRTGNHEHQFTLRSDKGTRIITDNCRIIAGGADTLSLWDKREGMYYHSNCYFEGYVDMVCPRGWAYITNSQFFTRGARYALWHDGAVDESQKLVVVNSEFDGEPGFQLGRRHYDAQFWLINARFSRNLADQPIFRKTYPEDPARDRPNLWGDRYYFYGIKKDGEPFSWLKDNLPVPVGTINPRWAFEGRWDPEADLARWRARAQQQ